MYRIEAKDGSKVVAEWKNIKAYVIDSVSTEHGERFSFYCQDAKGNNFEIKVNGLVYILWREYDGEYYPILTVM